MHLWFLGYPDQARQRYHEALALADALAHPFSQAFVPSFTNWLPHLCREVQTAREQAEVNLTLSTEQGFAYWLPMGQIVHGWAVAAQGQWQEGIAEIRQGLEAYRATQSQLAWPYLLALLAEAYSARRQIEEG